MYVQPAAAIVAYENGVNFLTLFQPTIVIVLGAIETTETNLHSFRLVDCMAFTRMVSRH